MSNTLFKGIKKSFLAKILLEIHKGHFLFLKATRSENQFAQNNQRVKGRGDWRKTFHVQAANASLTSAEKPSS